MPPLSIVLNPPQTRLKSKSMSTLVSGKDWIQPNFGDGSGIWIDPITFTMMLQPACLNPAWATTGTGIFFKYGIGDFTLIPAADGTNWLPNIPHGDASEFMTLMTSSGNPGASGITNDTYGINQPMVVEWFPYSASSSPYVVLECGWSSTGSGTVGVSLRFYNNGTAEVWKDGVCVGAGYSITGSAFGYFTQDQGNPLPTPATPQYYTTLLIPGRDRELLVVSTMGGGFSHIFDDLTEQLAGQTITDAGAFWFNIPAPATVNVRIAPLQFATNGTGYGLPSGWRKAPPSDTPDNLYVYRDLTGNGSATLSATGSPYNPYGVPYPVQLQIDLTGGPGVTPFVYGARAWYDAITADTPDESQDVTGFCTRASFDFSDTIGGKHFSFTLNQPAALEDLMGGSLVNAMGVACDVYDQNGRILHGVCDVPKYTNGCDPDYSDNGFSDDDYDRQQNLEFSVRDGYEDFEEFDYVDPTPYDGMGLGDAIREAARQMGKTATVSDSANDFTLPVGGISWNFLADVGDTGAEIMDRFHKTYLGNWSMDMDGDGNIVFTDPADMPSAPEITLYLSIAAAIAAGVDPDTAYMSVVKSWSVHVLEPEATTVTVMGLDFRSQRPIVVYQEDTDASDPTTAFADRPKNWIGKPKDGGWFDPSITTLAACQYTMGLLFPRLTAARQIVEFESEYLDGIPKGTLVTIDGIDDSFVDGAIRIKTFSGDFIQVDPDGDFPAIRPSRYVGEAGDLVCPLGVPGTNIEVIRKNWAIQTLSKYNFSWGLDEMTRRAPINVQGS